LAFLHAKRRRGEPARASARIAASGITGRRRHPPGGRRRSAAGRSTRTRRSERYARLLSLLRRRPVLAASGALAIALAAEALEAAERLIGPTDAAEARPGSGARTHRPRHGGEFL